jgi:hypothetical protein
VTTKLVVRLLNAEGDLLGSVVHHAAIKGDGCLRAAGPVVCGIAHSGFPSSISLHWCDVNVEVRVPSPVPSVQAGQIVPLFDRGAPLIVVGPMPGPLPAITVGEVKVPVPVGGIGAH